MPSPVYGFFFSWNLNPLSIIDRADNKHFSSNLMCLSNTLILNEARIVSVFRRTYVVPHRCSETQQECVQGNFILHASEYEKPLSICKWWGLLLTRTRNLEQTSKNTKGDLLGPQSGGAWSWSSLCDCVDPHDVIGLLFLLYSFFLSVNLIAFLLYPKRFLPPCIQLPHGGLLYPV